MLITKQYFFTVKDAKCNPDGHGEVDCQLVNGQLPGPTIKANWGDTIRVHVENLLKDNGTSLHFHGIRQLNTNQDDGVNGITECPLAPGHRRTYEWQATQYGTSWYHSHYTTQYGAGVQGPIQIEGPASAPYDHDLGPVVLSDFWYRPNFGVAAQSEANLMKAQAGVVADTYLINGKGKDAQGNGKYETFNVDSNKKYRMRLINTAAENAMRFSIDGHKLLVIAADLVPVKPFEVDSLMVGIGQRYDVVVTANQQANAWIRAEPESGCGAVSHRNGLALLKYSDCEDDIAKPEPTDTPHLTPCLTPDNIQPIWKSAVGTPAAFEARYETLLLDLDPFQTFTNGGTFTIWKFNKAGIVANWDDPTLSYIAMHNSSYPVTAAVIEIPRGEQWAYYVIQVRGSLASYLAHPMHLHGHDYYVLGRGLGVFNRTHLAQLNFDDPVRRDTDYTLGDVGSQQGSWFALAFQTGNPGAWLFHCHISTDLAGGMGVTLIDSKERIPPPDLAYYEQCAQWTEWYENSKYKKHDSGLK